MYDTGAFRIGVQARVRSGRGHQGTAGIKSYQLQAKAYDSTGQVGISNTVTVTSSR